MAKEIKFSKLKFPLKEEMFALVVDSSALYETNAIEMYRKAMIGENSTRSLFKQVLGIKDRVKLGLAEFDSVIKPGECEFDPTDSNISQKTFEVCPLMIGTSICIDSLEISFVSDQIAKGSSNFTDPQPFMNYFYETLGREVDKELAILTYQGDTTNPAFSGASAYLAACDGLEKQLEASTGVTKPATATTVNSNNVILKLQEARDAVPVAVRNEPDFVYIVSTNVWDAYYDAISENQQSGMYFVDQIDLKFQGVRIIREDGASDNVIIAGALSNFLNISDMTGDAHAFNIVDFMKTTLARKIGVRTDFKMKVSFLNDEEIYFHKP